jgi:PAS domain-containing protein
MPQQRRNHMTEIRSSPEGSGGEAAPGTLGQSCLARAEPTLLAAVLDTLAQVIPGGVAVLDRDLRYRWVNQQLAETNCLPAAEHVGRRVRNVVPELAEVAEPLFRQVLASGVPLRGLTFSGEKPGEPGELYTGPHEQHTRSASLR